MDHNALQVLQASLLAVQCVCRTEPVILNWDPGCDKEQNRHEAHDMYTVHFTMRTKSTAQLTQNAQNAKRALSTDLLLTKQHLLVNEHWACGECSEFCGTIVYNF